MAEFSVLLGLVDYLNPLLYLCFFLVLILALRKRIPKLHWICLLIGGCITLTYGFIIPTYKVLCGVGVFTFAMPEWAVFGTMIGFLSAGLALLIASYRIFTKKNLLLLLTYIVAAVIVILLLTVVHAKYNTIAVGFATIGLYLLYISVLGYAIREKRRLPLACLIFSMVMTATLSMVGIFGDMSLASLHWFTQIANICCQASLAAGTYLLFRKEPVTECSAE